MTGPVLLTGGRVVTPSGVLDGGAVLVRDGLIRAVVADPAAAAATGAAERVDLAEAKRDLPGAGRRNLAGAEPSYLAGAESVDLSGAERVDLAGAYLLPGFVDLHVHGAAGASYDDGAEAIAAAVAAHRRHGTTSTIVSLITAAPADMVASIRAAVAAAEADERIVGIHLEGPFLAESRRGAHDPAKLLAPDRSVLEELLRAGQGRVRMVTVAPELPGGLDLVRDLVAAGVHAAVGHSDAGYDAAAAAFDAGADLVTHAFNGMRPLHHRDPGIVVAAMDAGAVLEAINDGVHLHDATVRLLHAVAPDRLALVTDAMAAACAADGRYRLGSLDVDVVGGIARLAEGGSIAGSTLTMDVALRRAVHDVRLTLVDAVNAASLVPATLLGLDHRIGGIFTGRVADLVVTDDDLAVRAVMLAGQWADERRP